VFFRHSQRTTWFDSALISQLVSFLYGIFFPVLNSCTSPSFFFTVLFPHPSFLQHPESLYLLWATKWGGKWPGEDTVRNPKQECNNGTSLLVNQ